MDVCTAGITASIHSSAAGSDKGGDVYYCSVCSSDKLTRIAVADMRGHGEEVSHLSEWLYTSLQHQMNSLDGAEVLRELNDVVRKEGFHAITTAAVLSYYLGDSNLYYAYAGHPPAMLSQAGDAWRELTVNANPGLANLPLGMFPGVRYDQASLRVRPGDRLFVHTDGVTECPNPEGDLYGEERLKTILDGVRIGALEEVRTSVHADLLEHARGPLTHDDCTWLTVEIRA
jgi:sigma-B regulation protein RsbU (phosphoserine phosphatase)